MYLRHAELFSAPQVEDPETPEASGQGDEFLKVIFIQ